METQCPHQSRQRRQRVVFSLPSRRALFRGKENFSWLLFVAVETVYGRDGAEQAVLFAVDSSGEVERVGRSGCAVVTERERPQSIDGQDGIVRVFHETQEFVGEAVKGGDPAAAEIADENGVAELTKIARGPDNS